MWIQYDLSFETTNGIHKEVGLINSEKIQCMEITENALYVYISENYHLRFEHDHRKIYELFLAALKGQDFECDKVGFMRSFYKLQV